MKINRGHALREGRWVKNVSEGCITDARYNLLRISELECPGLYHLDTLYVICNPDHADLNARRTMNSTLGFIFRGSI